MTRSVMWLGSLVVGAALSLATPCAAQPKSPSGQFLPSAQFVVGVWCTARTGPTPAGYGTAVRWLAVGETRVLRAQTIDFNGGGVADWSDSVVRPTEFQWRVALRLLSVEIDTARFELNWSRYDTARETAQPVVGDKSVLTLRRGQRHLIDLAQAPSPSLPCGNMFVDVELRGVWDPPYAGLSIGYDLWLVHEDGAGKKTTRHLGLTGDQGETKPFSFEPIAFALGADVAPASPTVRLLVAGDLSARLKPDGNFELKLNADRQLRCGSGGGSGSGRGTGPEIVVEPGETIGMPFPNPKAWCGFSDEDATIAPAHPRPGVTTRADGMVGVAFDEFFATDKTTLLVTVTRRR